MPVLSYGSHSGRPINGGVGDPSINTGSIVVAASHPRHAMKPLLRCYFPRHPQHTLPFPILRTACSWVKVRHHFSCGSRIGRVDPHFTLGGSRGKRGEFRLSDSSGPVLSLGSGASLDVDLAGERRPNDVCVLISPKPILETLEMTPFYHVFFTVFMLTIPRIETR